MLLLASVLLNTSDSFAADKVFPVLDTGSQVYSNVTVTTQSATHLFINHSRGFAALKLNELSDHALIQLGLKQAVEPPKPKESIFKNPLSSSGEHSNPLATIDLTAIDL